MMVVNAKCFGVITWGEWRWGFFEMAIWQSPRLICFLVAIGLYNTALSRRCVIKTGSLLHVVIPIGYSRWSLHFYDASLLVRVLLKPIYLLSFTQ
jgi:hypothetical protein